MSESKVFGYVRVSSKDQNIDRQTDEIKRYVTNERDIFVDKASGKDFEREQYQAMKHCVRSGDTVYIKSLDRFGRNKEAIKQELQYFKNAGIIVKVLDLPTTMIDYSAYGDMQKSIMDMVNNILIEVLGTIAEQERQTIRKRQREGIEAAQKRGKHLGRPNAVYPPTWNDTYKQWKDGAITAGKAMDRLGLKRTTFYKLVKAYEA